MNDFTNTSSSSPGPMGFVPEVARTKAGYVGQVTVIGYGHESAIVWEGEPWDHPGQALEDARFICQEALSDLFNATAERLAAELAAEDDPASC